MDDLLPFFCNKTVCITGGTGFLGYHLVKQLLALQANVRILGLPPPAEHPLHSLPQVDPFYGDLLDPSLVRAALAGCDFVFHTAGTVAVWGPALPVMRRLHGEGTRLVLDAASDRATVVHTSSIVAVGAALDGKPVTEDTPFNLERLDVDYVHAKKAAEEIALAAAHAGRRVVVVNPGYLIGPEDHQLSVMGRLCWRFWKGRLFVAPPSGFNLVDVRDVARGHLLAACWGRSGQRYILGHENHSFRSLLTLLAQAAGWRPRGFLPMPGWLLESVAPVAEWRARGGDREPYPSIQGARMTRLLWYACADKARRELGFSPRPILESLRDAHAWLSRHHALEPRGLARWWLRAA